MERHDEFKVPVLSPVNVFQSIVYCCRRFEKKHGKEKATRKYVYNMFPYGYRQQACKIAGLRVQLKLLLDL